jgi:predicted RNA methylase
MKLRLFPFIDNIELAHKLKIDKKSIHYISLREVADNITNIIKRHLIKIKEIDTVESLKKISITDATAGVGGNTISFGMTFGKVNAIELDSERCDFLKNNINVYDLDNIDVYNGDCTDLVSKLYHQVVFIDPPWGGKSYKRYKNLLLSMSDKSIEDICIDLMDPTKSGCCPKLIVLKLPLNYNLKNILEKIQDRKIYLHQLHKMFIIVIENVPEEVSNSNSTEIIQETQTNKTVENNNNNKENPSISLK